MKKLLAITTVLFATTASAQTFTQSGKVTGYIPFEGGANQVLLFNIESNPTGGCNTASRFAIDSTATKFKGSQAALMSAYHSDSTVTILYTKTCNTLWNSWDVTAICVGTITC